MSALLQGVAFGDTLPASNALEPKSIFERETQQDEGDGKATTFSIIPAGVKFQPIDLDEELKLSELSPEQIDLLRTHSRGLMTVYDFFEKHRSNLRGGYALGLTKPLYYAALETTGLMNWGEFSEKFGMRWDMTSKPPIDSLMLAITTDNVPIVFFVPREIVSYRPVSALGYAYPSMTWEEMHWFLQHPEHMKKVHFVFGLNNMFSEKDAWELTRRRAQGRHVDALLIKDLVHMFNHLEDYHAHAFEQRKISPSLLVDAAL